MTLINKTILVTGGAGAIGSGLVPSLLNNNQVTVLDNLDSGYRDLVDERADFIQGSILNEALLKKVFESKFDIIFHLAAHFANQNSVDHPQKDLNVNGLGTLKLLQQAQKTNARFVYASSSCVYGNISDPITEDTTNFKLDTPYAISKLLGEHYCTYFHEFYELPTTILRIFNSFGPGERPGKYRNVIPNFFKLATQNKSMIITGTGEETRDFNFVDNTNQGLILAASQDAAIGQVFNIGSGVETSIKVISSLINEITKNEAPIIYQDRRNWDRVLRRCANIDKAKSLLGYKPVIDLKPQLIKTYEWFKENVQK